MRKSKSQGVGGAKGTHILVGIWVCLVASGAYLGVCLSGKNEVTDVSRRYVNRFNLRVKKEFLIGMLVWSILVKGSVWMLFASSVFGNIEFITSSASWSMGFVHFLVVGALICAPEFLVISATGSQIEKRSDAFFGILGLSMLCAFSGLVCCALAGSSQAALFCLLVMTGVFGGQQIYGFEQLSELYSK